MPPAAPAVLSVRVNPQERALLRAAALQARTSVSDFVRRKAIEAAEIDVSGGTVISIPAADWEKFEAWAASPPRSLPALRKLAKMKPVWQD